MLLEGIFLPITTPFHPDGRLFLHKLASNVEHYSRTQAAGILALGGVGEPDALNDEETRSVLGTIAVAASREKVLLAGVGRASVRGTLELADFAATAGYDAIAVRPNGGDEAEAMTYFQTVADGSPLPVVLLAERERPLSVHALGALAGHPTIIGAIDAVASHERCASLSEAIARSHREVTVTSTFSAVTRRMFPEGGSRSNLISAESLTGGLAVSPVAAAMAIKTRTKRVGFQYLAGSTIGMLASWQAGAVGAAPRLGAAAPQACCEVWQAFKDGDEPLATEKQSRIAVVAGMVDDRTGMAGLKYACDLNSYFGGRPRLPLLPCTAAERLDLERELAGIKN